MSQRIYEICLFDIAAVFADKRCIALFRAGRSYVGFHLIIVSEPWSFLRFGLTADRAAAGLYPVLCAACLLCLLPFAPAMSCGCNIIRLYLFAAASAGVNCIAVLGAGRRYCCSRCEDMTQSGCIVALEGVAAVGAGIERIALLGAGRVNYLSRIAVFEHRQCFGIGLSADGAFILYLSVLGAGRRL